MTMRTRSVTGHQRGSLYKMWKVCRCMPHLLYPRERCGHDGRGRLYMVLRLRQELSFGCPGYEPYPAEGFEMAEYRLQ